MPRFLGSPNGRLFAVVNGRELTLYRHDIALWKRSIELEDFTVLGLGNQGAWFVLSPAGLYVWPHDPNEPPIWLQQLGTEALAGDGKRLGRVKIGPEGTGVCVELIGGQGDKSGPRFRPGRSSSEQVHEFFFYDLAQSRQVLFHTLSVPDRLAETRVWDLSRNFRWMAFASAGKSRDALKITLLDLHNEYGPMDFPFHEPGFRGVYVNRDGTVCLDTFHEGVGRLHFFTRGHVTSQVRPLWTYEVEFFGATYLALRLTPGPFMLFKTLADKLISHVDMAPLRELGVEWELHYDQREELNLLTLRDGHFRILHTDPGRLEMDSRRFSSMLAGEHLIQGADEGETISAIYEDGIPDVELQVDKKRDAMHKALSRDLVRSVQEVRLERDTEMQQHRADLGRRLEALRLLYGTGSLPADEFERRRKILEDQLAALPAPVDRKASRPQRLSLPRDET